jgi:hypothetical protein
MVSSQMHTKALDLTKGCMFEPHLHLCTVRQVHAVQLLSSCQLHGGGVPRSTAGLDWEEYWKSTARIPQVVAACGLSA